MENKLTGPLEIRIGLSSSTTTVHANGVDLTPLFRGVSVEVMAGHTSKATLYVRNAKAKADALCALQNVSVVVEPPAEGESEPLRE